MNTASHPTQLLHNGFLSLLQRLQRHGEIYFRGVKCPDHKQNLIAETVALAWKWYRRLVQRGKDVNDFVSGFIAYAARAVKGGRRLCGQEKARDVLSPLAQKCNGFTLRSLPCGKVFDEALSDNTQTDVPAQVAFRLDFPAWLTTRTDRDRRIVLDLMAGERTLDVADKYHLSAGRVSQLRRDFMLDWERFSDGQREKRAGVLL